MNIIQKRVGIIGGGQLGKMMILEAKRLGLFTAVLDPAPDCPAHSISDRHIAAGFDDDGAYRELAGLADVITYEYEHISVKALEALERDGAVIYPSVASLKTIQNKYTQKLALEKAGIPVPRFAKVSGVEEILALGDNGFGYPMMLKSATGGYDGKGNAPIYDKSGAEGAYRQLGGGELMAEQFVDFEKEISIIVCRGADGARVTYPAAENIHINSILDTTIAPAGISEDNKKKAAEIADRVMEAFEGVGTFCVEMFLTAGGEIYVNEVAPRPHNSGHYTIEACFANQFENHIRAVTGLPLGNAVLVSPAVMVNLLGESDGPATLEGLREAYREPNVRVHFYGKTQSKTGRKMGHFTVLGDTAENARERAQRIRRVVRVVGESD
ncbi:MAG: 5-(carboxyamino)imidazole ribonucleotide synthase [Oscillospiraceae bacterium]|nr:5-(carboxyamino)imidazole ribonucleotide synthase [Oscillospiraceae bacterium]